MSTYREELHTATSELKKEMDFLAEIVAKRQVILQKIILSLENEDEDVKIAIQEYKNSERELRFMNKKMKDERHLLDKGLPKKDGREYGIRSHSEVFNIASNAYINRFNKNKKISRDKSVLDSTPQFTYETLRRPIKSRMITIIDF